VDGLFSSVGGRVVAQVVELRWLTGAGASLAIDAFAAVCLEQAELLKVS
jgi:hypothetical protein